MASFGVIILHPDLHAHFNRSVVHAIDRRTQDYEISHANRHQKIQVIDGRSYDICARVTMCSHGAGEVDPVHEASAEKRIQRIGIVRQNDLGHFRDRFADRPRAG